jgi:hypothetical protein
MMIIIDRIESAIAILEIDGETFEFPASALPDGAQEGDALVLAVARKIGTDLQRENEERLKRLRERDSGDKNIEL